jgi:glycosyltransferase involved in cell wall biosynthesis
VSVVPSVVDSAGDQEGLGLVTIEAMGCGCPIVASDLPAIRDVVEHGETGFLARPGDPDDLAKQLAILLSDPERAATIASSGRKFVMGRFDWERSADAYADLLHELV